LHNLSKEGAKLYVTDINDKALKAAADQFGEIAVSGDDIFDLDVDVFSPCALGAVLDTNVINRLKCQVIAGAANNQLANEKEHGPMLLEKGIFYAPDFLINAGGLINVYSEYQGYNRERALSATEKIYDTAVEIFKKASAENIPTQQAATTMAEQRVMDMMRVR